MKALLLVLASVVAFAACSSDEGDDDTSDAGGGSSSGGSSGASSSGGHGSEFPSCEAISLACHPFDNGDPSPAHDCHELAHADDANEPACFVAKDKCLAVCGGDGGTHEEHDGGGH